MLKVFLFVVALVATFFLFYGGLDPKQAVRSLKELWNLGHVFYFAVLTYLFNQWTWFDKYTRVHRWLISLMLAIVVGVLIEVMQYGTLRNPDIADISRDVTGCLLVLAFHPKYLKFTRSFYLVATRFVVGLIFLVHLIPLTIAVIDESVARVQFPVLSSFETPFETDRWYGEASRSVINHPEQESPLLAIGLTTALYSGVGMQYLPSDWRGYQSLYLRLFQPLDESLKITIRIHDNQHNNQYHDRFNRSFRLEKGWNEIQIALADVESAPAKRKLNLKQIENISLFSVSLPEPRVIYLDKIFLNN